MLQRYLLTAELEAAYAAIGAALAAVDPASLSCGVEGIVFSEAWGPPGQAATVLGVQPSAAVLSFQAALLEAVTPHAGAAGTSAAFVTDPGEEINAKTMDWVEHYSPDQVGEKYTAHLTVGVAKVVDLEAMQKEPFEAFAVHPAALSVYHLGNNGTARTLLKTWPLGS
jgi:hypothetical protein